MAKPAVDLRLLDCSSSSTVVLDPAAFLESWKQQIQGKHTIPVHQQRLTFASKFSSAQDVSLFSWSCVDPDQNNQVPAGGDFVKCMQSWQAILRSEKHNIARLLDPEVLTESDKLPPDLKCKAAEEFRDLGIPCKVYYLSFDKWILALQSQTCQGGSQNCKEVSKICIQIDNDFQLKEFEVDLYGRLPGSRHPFHFSYHFNGRHLIARLSMLHQTADYRQGQKKKHNRRNSPTVDKAVECSSSVSFAVSEGTSSLSEEGSDSDYYIPCSKDRELTVVISKKYCQLRSIVLTVITIPPDAPWKGLQSLLQPVNSLGGKKLPAPKAHVLKVDSKPVCVPSTRLHQISHKETEKTQHLPSGRLHCSTSDILLEHCRKKGSVGVNLSWTQCKPHFSIASHDCPSSREARCEPHISQGSDYCASSSFCPDSSSMGSSTKLHGKCSKSEISVEKVSKKKRRKKGKHTRKSRKHGKLEDIQAARAQGSTFTGSCLSDPKVVSKSGSPPVGECLHNEIPEVCSPVKGEVRTTHPCSDEILKPRSSILAEVANGTATSHLGNCIQNFEEEYICHGLRNSVPLERNITLDCGIEESIDEQSGHDDRNQSELMSSTNVIEVADVLKSDFSCQPISHFSDPLGTDNEHAPLELLLDTKITSFGDQCGSGGRNSQCSEYNKSDSILDENRVSSFHCIACGACPVSTSLGNESGKGSIVCKCSTGCGNVNCDGGSKRRNDRLCGNVTEKAKVIKVLDNDKRIEHNTEIVRCIEAEAEGNITDSESSISKNTHTDNSANMYSEAGKQNDHFILQNICKKLVDVKRPHPNANATVGNTTIQLLPREHSNCGCAGKEQSLKEPEDCQRIGRSQNHTGHSDVSGKHPVQINLATPQLRQGENSFHTLALHAKERSDVGHRLACATETAHGLWAGKETPSGSHEHISFTQVGDVDIEQHLNHSTSLNADCTHLPHVPHCKPQVHDTHQDEQPKTSSAPSINHECRDISHISGDSFSFVRSGEQVQEALRQMHLMSRTSNSVDQVILQTKEQGSHTIATGQIMKDRIMVDEDVFCPSLWKGRKSRESKKRASAERSFEHDHSCQQVSQKWVCVDSKCAELPKSGDIQENLLTSIRVTEDIREEDQSSFENLTYAASSQIADTSMKTNIHARTNKTRQSCILPKLLENDVIVKQEIKASKSDYVDHSTSKENGCVCEASFRCISQNSIGMSSPDGELKNVAQSVLDIINTAYQYQRASENITHAFGNTIAEFEKVLQAVSPIILQASDKRQCKKSSWNELTVHLVCRCQIADVSLNNIWQWYEEPGNYGLEVKAQDLRCSKKLELNGNPFRAYFVPFLSGMQLFGFRASHSGCKCAHKGNVEWKRNKGAKRVETCSVPPLGNLQNFSAILPKPAADSRVASLHEGCAWSPLSEDLKVDDLELLFEFYESEPPQQRRPMFDKMRELSRGGGSLRSQPVGGPHILDCLKLGDLHPASWFAVSWYPIYQIPEGHLRAAFLTYHSFGHFVDASTSNTLDGHTGCNIVAPVVGLQSYNAECWFVLRKQYENLPVDGLPSNLSGLLQKRLKTLEETAALMSRGMRKQGTAISANKHPDYEFFVCRRR